MHGPGKDVRLRSSARTNVGRVRENNEDNVHLWVSQDDSVLAIVADGMGGAAAGEEASRLAVEAIQDGIVLPEAPILQSLESLNDEIIAQKMREIIRIANDDIMRRASNDPELRGMGTTVTLAFVRGMHVIVAHVGDSRAYLVSGRDKSITQITADHSFVQALLAAGHITAEQAENHPMGNVLYRALGQTEDLDVDVYHTRLRVGDRLILCSDGLTRHVKAADITDIAFRSENPDDVAQMLIDLTNERGGEDNVSVVVIMVEGEPDPPASDVTQKIVFDDDTILLRKSKTPAAEFSDTEETLKLDNWSAEQLDDSDDTLDHSITSREDVYSVRQEDGESEGRDNRHPE